MRRYQRAIGCWVMLAGAAAGTIWDHTLVVPFAGFVGVLGMLLALSGPHSLRAEARFERARRMRASWGLRGIDYGERR